MAHLCRAVRAGAAVRFAVWAGCVVVICCERAAPGGVIQRQQSQALDLVRCPGDSLSKAITHYAARQYKLKFSTFPPLTESGWFAVWLSDLGGKLGHPFSAKQAATALAQWRAYQDPAGKVPG